MSFLTITDLSTAQVPGPTPFVVDGWIPAAECGQGIITSLCAPGGMSKTFLAIYIAIRVVLGKDVFGRATIKGDVLIVDGESGVATITRRLAMVVRGLGLEAPPRGLVHVSAATLTDGQAIVELQAIVEQLRPVLIIVDSFNALLTRQGAETSRPENVAAQYRALMSLGTAVLVIDHTPHSDSSRPMDSVQKSNGARSVLNIAPDGEYRRIIHRKTNDVEQPDVRYRMTFSGTDPRTDAAVVFEHVEPGFAPSPRVAVDSLILEAFDAGTLTGPQSSTNVAAILAVPQSTIKKALDRLHTHGELTLTNRKYTRKRSRSGHSRTTPDSKESGRAEKYPKGAPRIRLG